MPKLEQRFLTPVAGNRSHPVGLFLWQMDDQSRRLTEDTRGATPDELGWQPAPGMNTIGQLLAHIAVVEVRWINRAVLGPERGDEGDLGITRAEIGIPMPEEAAAPAALGGRDLAYFDDLRARARARTKQLVATLTDADLDRRYRFMATWTTDTEFECTVGWTLYHVLEHEAGHYGQVNLLRHLHRVRAGAMRT
ncbi:MAG: DinB family protein [Candidatus Eisenbacteria bacterium]|uniref:DinB family protein n=1 Tax=Eiseniibacteriota bacterium TaxID=2212470 RepID=A0A9D6QME1_UNCEI|nr:DinB family protein [Candidatus Eisenbacteria bacterium]MBI3539663.1 DinB family protein [Candidatus Eisenbacteria bacterium]